MGERLLKIEAFRIQSKHVAFSVGKYFAMNDFQHMHTAEFRLRLQYCMYLYCYYFCFFLLVAANLQGEGKSAKKSSLFFRSLRISAWILPMATIQKLANNIVSQIRGRCFIYFVLYVCFSLSLSFFTQSMVFWIQNSTLETTGKSWFWFHFPFAVINFHLEFL